jgi:hypothetical protein
MRTRTALTAAGCFALLTLAACGSQATTSPATGTGPTIAVAPPTSVPVDPPLTPVPLPTGQPVTPPGAAAKVVPAGQIDTSHLAANPPRTVGTTSDGKRVVFTVEQSGCQHIAGRAGTQTATSVTIQVITTTTTQGNQVCPMIVRDVPVSVALNAPLGSRMVVFVSIKHAG